MLFLIACTAKNGANLTLESESLQIKEKLKIGQIIKYKIIVVNTGDDFLTIANVVGDCNCIGLTWRSVPIAPQKTDTIFGSLKITDTLPFKKYIVINSNSKNKFSKFQLLYN